MAGVALPFLVVAAVLAAITSTPGLAVCIDYSQSLRWIGGVPTHGSVGHVAVSGQYAYAAEVVHGLEIINVSNPGSPALVAQLPISGGARDVAVTGFRAYVAAPSGLFVLGVSNPTSPVFLGSVSTADARTLAVEGNHVFLGDGVQGFLVVDVSNTASPHVVGQVSSLGGLPTDIAMSGHYAFVTALGAGLHVIDVSAPDAPVLIATLDTPGSAHGVAVSGGLVYVGDGTAGVQVIDVSSPAAPWIVANAPVRRSASGLAVSGHYVFLGDEAMGMEVLDVTDPAAPVYVGSIRSGSYTFDMTIVGHYAYAACWGSGVQVIDITAPFSPPVIGSVLSAGSIYDVVVRDNLAFVACDDGGFQIMDISLSDEPRVIGSLEAPGHVRGVAVAGHYAYVASAWYGLLVVDISDPTAPAVVGTVETSEAMSAVAVRDSRAYLAAQHAVIVVDIANPAAPHRVWDLDFDFVEDLLIVNDVLYVASVSGSLGIVDLQTGSTSEVSVDDEWISSITVADGYLLAVGGYPGVAVLDMENPLAPVLLGKGGGCSPHAWGVAGAGGYAYVATGSGMEIVAFSVPSQPVLVGGTTTWGSPFAAAVDDEHLYIGDADIYTTGRGFRVASLQCADNPTAILLAPSATVTTEGILVSWEIPEGIELDGIEVERLVTGDAAGWVSISPRFPVEASRGEYLDRNVEAGTVYQYAIEAFAAGASVGRYGPITIAAGRSALPEFRISPNPGKGAMEMCFVLPTSGDVLVRIFDVAGREVARDFLRNLGVGVQRQPWDVRDASNRALGAGAYLVRADLPSGTATARWIVLR